MRTACGEVTNRMHMYHMRTARAVRCQVQMMAYAPFMGHEELTTWRTTLITFNDTRHWTETPSYVVQQVYSKHWRGSCVQVRRPGGGGARLPVTKSRGVAWGVLGLCAVSAWKGRAGPEPSSPFGPCWGCLGKGGGGGEAG